MLQEVKARRLNEVIAAFRAGQAALNQAEIGRMHLVRLTLTCATSWSALIYALCIVTACCQPAKALCYEHHAMFASHLHNSRYVAEGS